MFTTLGIFRSSKIIHTGNLIFSHFSFSQGLPPPIRTPSTTLSFFGFQKKSTYGKCHFFKKFNILDSIGIHYILFLYTNYYTTFSQEWVGKYILTYQGKEGGILHLTYQGKEVGILHLTYQRKQYIAIYSKTLSQSLLFTNRIHTLHLTLYGKQRETKTHYIYSKENSHSMSSFFKDKGPLLLRENRPTQGRYFTTKRATLCPSVLRTKDLFF